MLATSIPVMLCVPARDEAALLPQLVRSLGVLRIAPHTLTVCLYLDGCTDASQAVLQRSVADFPFGLVVRSGARSPCPNAGSARRAAMAIGLEILGDRDGLLFSTDADSCPHADWIDAGVAALQVADVVTGRILRISAAADPVQTRVETYYDRLHRLRRRIDPVPWEASDTHHFTGAANLAIRSSVYRAIGGFRPIAHGEDATLLDDAARAGWRVRRDAAMLVDTSSRRIGRAEQGLATGLSLLAGGQSPMVAHPAAAAWQWHAQAAARHAFAAMDQPDQRVGLGRLLALSADHVLGVARDCPNAEAFATRIVPSSPVHAGAVTLEAAETALSLLEQERCEVAA